MSVQFLPVAVAAAFSTPVMGERRISEVYWYNPANIADTVTFQDSDGNLLWQGRCEVANSSQVFRFPTPFMIHGFSVPTLASGTFYIYG